MTKPAVQTVAPPGLDVHGAMGAASVPTDLAKHPPFQMFLAETELAADDDAKANAEALLGAKGAVLVDAYVAWWEAKRVWAQRGETPFGT